MAELRNVYNPAVLLCNFIYFQLRIYTNFRMIRTIHRMLHNLKHGLAIRALVTDQVPPAVPGRQPLTNITAAEVAATRESHQWTGTQCRRAARQSMLRAFSYFSSPSSPFSYPSFSTSHQCPLPSAMPSLKHTHKSASAHQNPA